MKVKLKRHEIENEKWKRKKNLENSRETRISLVSAMRAVAKDYLRQRAAIFSFLLCRFARMWDSLFFPAVRFEDCMTILCFVRKVNRRVCFRIPRPSHQWWRRIAQSLSRNKSDGGSGISVSRKICFDSFSQSCHICFQGFRFDSANSIFLKI